MANVAQELKETRVSWEVGVAETPKYLQGGLEQGKQTLRSILVHLAVHLFLLGVIDERMHIALHRAIAARRVRGEPPAHVHRDVSRLLHGLHSEISCRLDNDCPLTTDPCDDCGPVFLIVAPAGLTFLAAPRRATPQMFFATLLGLALLASRVREVICFHPPFQLAVHLVGQRGIAEPPAPARTGPNVDAHFAGYAS